MPGDVLKPTLVAAFGIAALTLSATVGAGSRDDLLARYAAAAGSAGLSAERGRDLHTRNFAGGKPGDKVVIGPYRTVKKLKHQEAIIRAEKDEDLKEEK